MIPKWKGYAKLYEDGYDIEDYFCEFLNDMDARHLIDRVLKVLNQREREMIAEEIEPYDKLFIEWTVELKTCVWGEKNEKDKGYNRKDNWYYYRAPENLIAIEPEKFLNK